MRTTLSDREVQVLRLIADGLTNEQIGRQLHVSTETIKTHVCHLLLKTGSNKRTSLVAWGFRTGLLE